VRADEKLAAFVELESQIRASHSAYKTTNTDGGIIF
jgi:hypothetical protein